MSSFLIRAAGADTPEIKAFRKYCESQGFAIDHGSVSTVTGKPTGYVLHNVSIKDVVSALTLTLNLVKDKKQYKGHVNYTTKTGRLVQFENTRSGIVVSYS